MNKRVLIVEDETNLARFIELELTFQGFVVEKVVEGNAALEKIAETNYNMIILDSELPGELQGIDVLKKFRAAQGDVALAIMFSENMTDADEIETLDAGADLLLRKPFEINLLMAHIRAMLRRIKELTHEGAMLTYKDITINTSTYQIFIDDEEKHLTRKEYELLLFLIHNKGSACSRQKIMEEAWGEDFHDDTNSVDVYVRYIRMKLGKDYIRTVRSVGYYVD